MGGSNQATIPHGANAGTDTGSSIRIHESNSEIHFHDDQNGLKVAVPVHEFDQKWENCKKALKPTSFIDASRGTVAHLEPNVEDGKIDVAVTVNNLSYGDTFQALDQLGT